MSDDSSNSFFNINLDEGGVGPGASIGQFRGQTSQERRSWVGRYRDWSFSPDFVDLFRGDDVPVTFTKD